MANPSWQELLDLVEQLNRSDYDSASVQFGDVSVRLSKSGVLDQPVVERAQPTAMPATLVSTPAKPLPGEGTAGIERNEHTEVAATIDAPMVGVFYRRPAPGAEPFVKAGDRVDADTTIGIIEIMKLMNPVSAGVAGVLGEFLVEDGAAVEFGQALVSVHPSE